MSLTYAIRAMASEEKAFVADAWAKGMKAGNRPMRYMDSALFFCWARPLVNELLDSPTVNVRVAMADDGVTIYGFIVYEPGCMHFVFTRKSMRRLGIARKMLEGIAFRDWAFSTWTTDLNEWILEKHPDMRHMPLWIASSLLKPKTSGPARHATALSVQVP